MNDGLEELREEIRRIIKKCEIRAELANNEARKELELFEAKRAAAYLRTLDPNEIQCCIAINERIENNYDIC